MKDPLISTQGRQLPLSVSVCEALLRWLFPWADEGRTALTMRIE